MMSEELILKIKDALDITFEDEDFGRKIVGIIEDGIPILRSLFGVEEGEEIDWTKPSQERMLLKNYCLYELNNVSEKFSENYRSEILAVRAKNEVKQWKKANSTDTVTE